MREDIGAYGHKPCTVGLDADITGYGAGAVGVFKSLGRCLDTEVAPYGAVVLCQRRLDREEPAVESHLRLVYKACVCPCSLCRVVSDDVACVILTVWHDEVRLLRCCYRGYVSCEAALALAEREAGEIVTSHCAHDVLAWQNARLGMPQHEVLHISRLHAADREYVVHEPCHHDAVALHAHSPCPDIGSQEPCPVRCCLLPARYFPESLLLEEERVGIASHACHCRVGCHLVVEEEAPVVAIGHSLLPVGQCEPVEHILCDRVTVMEQCLALPFLSVALEQPEGERGLSELLYDDVLV